MLLNLSFFSISFVSIIPSSISLGELIFLFTIFFGFKYWIMIKNTLNIKKYFIFYLVILVILISLLFNLNDYTFNYIEIAQPFYTLYILFLLYLTIKYEFITIEKVIQLLLYSSYVHFVFSCLQMMYPEIFYFGISLEQRSPILYGMLYRSTGLFTNPNDLMVYLSALIPFTYMLNYSKTRYIMLTTLLMTFSKVALFIVPLVLMFDFIKLRLKYKIFFIVPILFIIYTVANLDSINEIFMYRFENADSIRSRIVPVLATLTHIEQWFYVGNGPLGDSIYTDIRVHNVFLSIFVQYGFVMIAIVMLYYISILLKIRYKYDIYFFTSFILWTLAMMLNTAVYFKVIYIVPLIVTVYFFNRRLTNVRNLRNK